MKLPSIHLSALCCALLLLTAPLSRAQSPAPAAHGEGGVHSKTLWEQIEEGGWVMIPIGICSVLTLYLIGDGVLRTSRNASRRRGTSKV